jgi:hypothetical protein
MAHVVFIGAGSNDHHRWTLPARDAGAITFSSDRGGQ